MTRRAGTHLGMLGLKEPRSNLADDVDLAASAAGQRPWHTVLLALLTAAMAIRLGAWWRFPNIHHSDEVFQYQEPAYRLFHGYGIIAWEYVEGVRAWYLPGILAALAQLSQWLTRDQSAWPYLVAIVLSLTSLSAVWLPAAYGRKLWGLPGAVLAGGCGAIWFELVYFAPKTLTSPIAGNLILFAVLALGLGLGTVGRRRMVLGGVLMGLAFLMRPHLAPALAVLALGSILSLGIRRSGGWIVLGGVTTLVAGGLIDLLTFDYPYQWFVRNYQINLQYDMASGHGTAPWHWYLRHLAGIWGIMTPALAVLFVAGACRLPVPAATAIAVMFTHMTIAHKEYRFVYPAVALGLVVCAHGAVAFASGWAGYRGWGTRQRWACAVVAVLLVIGVGAMRSRDQPYRGYWISRRFNIQAFEALRRESNLQALTFDAERASRWYMTPGSAALQREITLHQHHDRGHPPDPGTYTHLLTTRSPDLMSLDHDLIMDAPTHDYRPGRPRRVYLYRYTGLYRDSAVPLNQQLAERHERWMAKARGRRDNPEADANDKPTH